MKVREHRNDGRGSMMGKVMPHPMHAHGGPFRGMGGSVSSASLGDHASVGKGCFDTGWKDASLAMPGERVRVLLRSEDCPGLFLCDSQMLRG